MYVDKLPEWGGAAYAYDNEDGQTACECGGEQTMKLLLVCPILPHLCTHEHLEEFNPELDRAPSIVRKSCNDSRRRKSIGTPVITEATINPTKYNTAKFYIKQNTTYKFRTSCNKMEHRVHNIITIV